MSEVVNESIVGVVGLGAVDDNCLEVVVPGLRTAEELAQVSFGEGVVSSEAFDESVTNVVENVGRVGVSAVVSEGDPDVVAVEVDELFHGKILLENKKSPEPKSEA